MRFKLLLFGLIVSCGVFGQNVVKVPTDAGKVNQLIGNALDSTAVIIRNSKSAGDSTLWFKSAGEIVAKRIVNAAGTNNDSTLYIPIDSISFDGNDFYFDTVGSVIIVKTRATSEGSGTADSIRVLTSRPSLGNVYIDSATQKAWIKTSGYWNRVSFDSSVAISPYGPELVTNGVFSADASWNKGASGVTITGGEAVAASVGAYALIVEQSISIVNGHTYKVEFDATNYVSGNFAVLLGDYSANVVSTPPYTANGHYSVTLTLADPDIPAKVFFSTWNLGATVHIDNVTVKEVY